jgi:hypothetical protein
VSEFDAEYAARLALLGDELARLERRLRGMSAAAWRSRTEIIRALLVDLVAIEAGVRDTSPHELPVIADYALADALVVIGGDVVEALVVSQGDRRVEEALSIVRSSLAATR